MSPQQPRQETEGKMGIAAVSWDLEHPNRVIRASLALHVGGLTRNMGMCEPYVLLLRGANRGKESRDGDVIHNHQDLPCNAAFLLNSPLFSSLLRSPCLAAQPSPSTSF